MKAKTEGVDIVATGPQGEVGDMSAIEEAGMGFDPTKVHLDLTKEEKRRTTALLLAIQAYDKLIIKDAEMYEAITRDNKRDGATIRPATMDAMVSAALNFDDFISGKLQIELKKATEESLAEQEKKNKKASS